MGPLGWQETVFIFVLALLLFGPKKLPELGKTIGKALTEFRRASNDLKSTFDREMANLEKETESIKQATNEMHSEIQTAVYDGGSGYDYSYSEQGYDGYQPYESASSSESTTSASAVEGADSTTAGNSAELATTSNGSASAPHTGPEGTVPVETATAAPQPAAPEEVSVAAEASPRSA